MKCINCSQEINSTFAFAIKSNQCPACGKNLYAQELADSFNQFHPLFTEIKSMEELLLTILSKYDLVEKNTTMANQSTESDEQPTTEIIVSKPKVNKVKTNAVNTEPPAQKLVSQERMDLIKKRAGIDKLPPTSKIDKLKQMVNEIQATEEAEDNSDYEDDDNQLDDAEPLADGTSLEGLFDATEKETLHRDQQNFKINQLKQLHRRQDMVESGSSGLIKRTS